MLSYLLKFLWPWSRKPKKEVENELDVTWNMASEWDNQWDKLCRPCDECVAADLPKMDMEQAMRHLAAALQVSPARWDKSDMEHELLGLMKTIAKDRGLLEEQPAQRLLGIRTLIPISEVESEIRPKLLEIMTTHLSEDGAERVYCRTVGNATYDYDTLADVLHVNVREPERVVQSGLIPHWSDIQQ
jgi:hypothetical protein